MYKQCQFPELAGAVKGEENNVFSNTLGETITVEVCSSSEKTAELLRKVLDDDQVTADLLSREVHREIVLTDVAVHSRDIPTDFDIDISDLGIWIDPIGMFDLFPYSFYFKIIFPYLNNETKMIFVDCYFFYYYFSCLD